MNVGLHQQPIKPSKDVPVDVSEIISRSILSVVCKLETDASARRCVQAGKMSLPPAFHDEAEVCQALQEGFVDERRHYEFVGT